MFYITCDYIFIFVKTSMVNYWYDKFLKINIKKLEKITFLLYIYVFKKSKHFFT